MRTLRVGMLLVLLGFTSTASAATVKGKFDKQIAKRAVSTAELNAGKFKRLCLYTGGDANDCNRRVGFVFFGTFQGDSIMECGIPTFTPAGDLDLNTGFKVCNDPFVVLP